MKKHIMKKHIVLKELSYSEARDVLDNTGTDNIPEGYRSEVWEEIITEEYEAMDGSIGKLTNALYWYVGYEGAMTWDGDVILSTKKWDKKVNTHARSNN